MRTCVPTAGLGQWGSEMRFAFGRWLLLLPAWHQSSAQLFLNSSAFPTHFVLHHHRHKQGKELFQSHDPTWRSSSRLVFSPDPPYIVMGWL